MRRKSNLELKHSRERWLADQYDSAALPRGGAAAGGGGGRSHDLEGLGAAHTHSVFPAPAIGPGVRFVLDRPDAAVTSRVLPLSLSRAGLHKTPDLGAANVIARSLVQAIFLAGPLDHVKRASAGHLARV